MTSWGGPRSGGYRVSDAAGVGHPTSQRSGGVAVVILVFTPVFVVFSATALKLREEASKKGSFCHCRGPGTAGGGPGRRYAHVMSDMAHPGGERHREHTRPHGSGRSSPQEAWLPRR